MESATARRISDGRPGSAIESPSPPPQRRCRASNSGVTVTARPSTRNRPEYMAGASIVAVAISSPPPQLRQLPSDIAGQAARARSEEHTSELQSLMRISYAVFCLKKKKKKLIKRQQYRDNR